MNLEVWNILVGEVVAPHGIAGEIKVFPCTEHPERFNAGSFVCLQEVTGERRIETIQASRCLDRHVLVKLMGCTDRAGAERLRKALFFVREDMLTPLPEGRYYVKDLIGLEVVTTEGESLGAIEDVLETAANDVYVTPGGLIPASKEVVQTIDLKTRKVTIQVLPGLLTE